ncbi:hypothetical protein [Planktothrix agardhii]|nr:hypothetical protein [Planktothrix agardhii]MBG0746469.1 hypothetical protein [Planktothrix agardhii KL2]MDS1346243.1 hypothetical protein [Planktothrix agardhii NRERC-751]
MSRKFIQLMGGDISVESELGKGTTFQFYIQVKLGQEIVNNSKEAHLRVIKLAPGQPYSHNCRNSQCIRRRKSDCAFGGL